MSFSDRADMPIVFAIFHVWTCPQKKTEKLDYLNWGETLHEGFAKFRRLQACVQHGPVPLCSGEVGSQIHGISWQCPRIEELSVKETPNHTEFAYGYSNDVLDSGSKYF